MIGNKLIPAYIIAEPHILLHTDEAEYFEHVFIIVWKILRVLTWELDLKNKFYFLFTLFSKASYSDTCLRSSFLINHCDKCDLVGEKWNRREQDNLQTGNCFLV